VLGDNRDEAFDSRKFGFVPKEMVVGKFYSRYWKASN
ncbi:MAG: S26 family signal peptidase, partial [Acidobacteriota bacterium]